MLVEFLLNRDGKKKSDQLSDQEFKRFTPGQDLQATNLDDTAVATTMADVGVLPAAENCPAFAMGLTAESSSKDPM